MSNDFKTFFKLLFSSVGVLILIHANDDIVSLAVGLIIFDIGVVL